jgi:ABC-2 type transport system permease protein
VDDPMTDETITAAKHSATLPFPPRDAAGTENSARSLLRISVLQCHRIVTKWVGDPITLVQALVFPALMVLLFWLVLDRTVSGDSGVDSALGTVPMVALTGAMSGASISGLGLRREWTTGLLAKMWTLPVHRASAMLGRLFAEAVRVAVTVSFILLVGTLTGFRFETGVLGALAILAIAVVFGLAFSVMVTAFALLSETGRIVEWIAVGTNLAMFFNSGFVPVSSYPGWLQPIVRYQPLSCAVDAMRGLAAGTDVVEPVLLTLLWSAGLVLVFVRPILIGYQRAARKH